MRKTLTIFEKFFLCFRGMTDAWRHTVSLVDCDDSDCKKCESAFVTDELSKMHIHSKNVFFRRYSIALFNDKKNKKKHSIIRFFDAIAIIDRDINDAVSGIVEVQTPYNVQKEKNISLQTAAIEKHAVHLVRMYENRLVDIEAKRKSAVNKSYKTIEFLLNEKIRLFKKALAYQDNIQCRSLLRIQYYYDKVCQFDKKCPIISLSFKNYSDKIDMSFLECYQEQLKDAENHLDDIINRREII